MTDGPFRNLPLNAHWKAYGKELVSDASDLQTRVAHASRSMLGNSCDLKAISDLFKDLEAIARRPQMDLDPWATIEANIDLYVSTPLIDALQRNLRVNLSDHHFCEAVLHRAFESAISDEIATTKARLDEECLRSRDRKDMSWGEYQRALTRNAEAFAAVNRVELRGAAINGSSADFRRALAKKVGVDEGPDE